MTKKTLNLTELAEYTSIHKRKLYRLIADDKFPVEPLRGMNPRLWSTEQIDKWLSNGGEIEG